MTPSLQLDVSVRGDDDARRLLERLGMRLEGDRSLFRLVDFLLDAERERFASGHGGSGAADYWTALKIESIRRNGPHRLMILTGNLMRSLTVKGAPGQIVRGTPRTLTFGTRVYYARFHQKGKGVPKRVVVGLTRVQRKQAVSRLRDLLLEDL